MRQLLCPCVLPGFRASLVRACFRASLVRACLFVSCLSLVRASLMRPCACVLPCVSCPCVSCPCVSCPCILMRPYASLFVRLLCVSRACVLVRASLVRASVRASVRPYHNRLERASNLKLKLDSILFWLLRPTPFTYNRYKKKERLSALQSH